MTEIPIRVDLNGNTKSKSDEKPEFIVNGKEIKSHAELSKKEYLKELLSPKNKYGLGSNRSPSILKSGNRNNPYIEKWGSMYYMGPPTFQYTGYFCYLTSIVDIDYFMNHDFFCLEPVFYKHHWFMPSFTFSFLDWCECKLLNGSR